MPTVIVASTPDQIPTAPVDGKITTVYWNICGLGQPVRLALALAKADFVDVRIVAGDPATQAYKKMWFDNQGIEL